MNRLGQTSNMLAPYTGLGQSSTQTSPLYQNRTGNILGGITAGLGLYNAYNNASGGGSNMANQVIDPYNYASNYG